MKLKDIFTFSIGVMHILLFTSLLFVLVKCMLESVNSVNCVKYGMISLVRCSFY